MNMLMPLELGQRTVAPLELPTTFRCRVTHRVKLSATVLQVMLDTPADFPAYQAGQYIELQTEDGTSRPFSVANFSPESSRIELHIEERPDSKALCDILQQMDEKGEIDVKPPAGDVQLKPSRGPQIFLAAGSGFAQIKSLLEAYFSDVLDRSEQALARIPLYLFWGADHPDQRYMEQLVEDWCQRYSCLRYRPLSWQDGESWEEAITNELTRFDNCRIYACGSPQRVYQALQQLEQRGLPTTSMQSDVFAYAPRPAKGL